MTTNKTVLAWLEEMKAMTKPEKVLWIDGSEEQLEALRKEAVETGEMIKLNQEIQAAREMAAKNMITYYENSRSWKITAPFRRVAKEVKKLRGRR